MDEKRERKLVCNVYYAMKFRCYSRKCKQYDDYGGRSITICDEWLNDKEKFLSDMGPRPTGYSLERIDNDGNYEPANCRWASRAEQAANRRPRGPMKNRRKAFWRHNNLSEIAVLLIRQDKRSTRIIAEDYGISRASVWAVRTGRSYKWIE